MRAVELFRTKEHFGRGIIKIVIWLVPEPVPPSEHPYRYRRVYVTAGKRVVCYANERGKGDHLHIGDYETPYRFVRPQQLVSDLWLAVKGATHE